MFAESACYVPGSVGSLNHARGDMACKTTRHEPERGAKQTPGERREGTVRNRKSNSATCRDMLHLTLRLPA